MRRAILLATLLVGGALSIAATAKQADATDRTLVIRTLSVFENLYVIGGGGGNSAALMTDEGVVLVDTKLPGWGQAVLDAIGSVTDRPVTMIINTHVHEDHTGSNNAFPMAVEVIAHERTKASMAQTDAFKGEKARFLPNKTFTDRLSLTAGGDPIDLYYFGPGHTNGDAVVVFRRQRVAHFGDLFPGKTAPVIDVSNGGSGVALPQTLARAVAEIKGVDRVITGHDPGASRRSGVSGSGSGTAALRWSDLQEYADFTRDFLAAVQTAEEAGKDIDDAASSLALADRYKSYDMKGARAAVQAIYSEHAK